MLLNIDCHSHILPGIDDGSRNVGMSIGMIDMLFSQGVRRIVATPHFRSHQDNVAAFTARRADAFERLRAELDPQLEGKIFLGAEVAIEYGLSEIENIADLTYQGTKYILLELPYRPFERWMTEEITNIAYEHGLTPVVAHIDRYAEWYSSRDYDEIFSLDSVLFQINNEAFLSRKSKGIVKKLISNDRPFILGSDCHNMENRKPNFDISASALKKYEMHYEAERFFRSLLNK